MLTDDLLVKVELDTANTKKSAQEAAKQVTQLTKSLELVQRNVRLVQQSLNQNAGSITQLTANNDELAVSYAEINESMNAVNLNLTEINTNLAAANDLASAHSSTVESQTKTYEKASSGLSTFAKAITYFVTTASGLINIFKFLTDDANLIKLGNIFKILGSLAKIKGNDKLAKDMENAAQSVELTRTAIQKFRDSASENFEGATVAIERLRDAIESLRTAGSVGLALGVTAAAVKGFSVVAPQAAAQAQRLGQTLLGTAFSFDQLKQSMERATTLRGFMHQVQSNGAAISDFGAKVQSVGAQHEELAKGFVNSERRLASAGRLFRTLATHTETASGKLNAASEAVDRIGTPFFKLTRLGNAVSGTLGATAEVTDLLTTRLTQIAVAAETGSGAFGKLAANAPTVGKVIAKVGEATTLAGNAIRGVGTDMLQLPKIIKSVVTATPALGGAFASALAVTSSLSVSFIGLGYAMLKADSAFVKVAGGSLIALGLALGGVLAAAKALSSVIGGFISSVGAHLFTFFDAGIDAAIEDERVAERLSKTIQVLSGSVAASKPILESWEIALADIAKTSALAGSEAQNLAISVAQMGQELKLSQTDQEGVAKSIAAFAKNGEEAAAMASALRAAFLGEAKQAEALGINLNDLALANSEYVRGLGKGVDELTKSEKVHARLQLLYAQAAVATATLANTGESLAAVQHKVRVAQGELSAEFAQASIPLYKNLAAVQLFFLNGLRAMPQAFKDAANVTSAYAGGILIVVGQVMKYAFAVGGLLGLLASLNALLKTSAALQAILSAAFAITNGALGAQFVAVTSLNAVMTNFILLLRGALVASLQAVYAALLAATRGVYSFTAALLTNPVFWKAAVVVVGLASIIAATRELVRELDVLSELLGDSEETYDKAAKAGSSFGAVLSEIKDFALDLFEGLKQISKFIITGFVANFLFAARAITQVRLQFATSKDEAAKLEARIVALNAKLRNAGDVARDSAGKLANLFTATAHAASGANAQIDKTSAAITRFRSGVATLRAQPFDAAALSIEVLGDEFQRAAQAAAQANLEYSRSVDTYLGAEERTQDMLTKTAQLREEAAKAQLGVTRLVQEAVRKLGEEDQTLTAESLKSQGKLAQAARLEADKRLRDFDKQIAAVQQVTRLQGTQLALVKRMRTELIAQGNAQVEAAQLDEQQKVVDIQQRIAERALATSQRMVELRGEELNSIRMRGAAELGNTARLIHEVKVTKELSDEQRKVALASLEATQAAEGQLIYLQLQKHAQAEVQAIASETVALAQEFAELGKTEVQRTQMRLATQLQLLEVRREQLELDREINAEAIAALTAQAELLSILAQERVFQIEVEESSDFGQVLAGHIRAAGDSVNKAIGALNSAFGTEVPKLTQGFVNAVALGASRAVTSFEGAFETLGLGIGSAITGSFNYGVWAVNKVFGTAFDELPNVLGETLGALGAGMGKAVEAAIPAIAALFNADGIERLAADIKSFVTKLPAQLMSAFASLADAFQQLVEKLPDAVGKIVDALPAMVGKLMDALPQVVAKLMDALGSLLDRLPEIAARIIDAIPGILSQILERLPSIITKLFDAVGLIIAQVIKAFPEIFKMLMDNLPSIIESLITGFLSAAGDIAAAFVDWFTSGGAEKMVAAFLRAIPRLIAAVVNGIVNGLGKALGSIFGKVKVPTPLQELPQKFSEGLQKLAVKATEESSKLFKVLDLQASARGMETAKSIENAVDAATTRLATRFTGLLDGLVAAWRWINDNIIKPAWEALKAAWMWVYDNIIKPAWAALKAVWDIVFNALTTLWSALKQIWDGVFSALTGLWNTLRTIFTAAVDGLTAVWNLARNVFQPIVDALQRVYELLTGVGTKIANSLWNGLVALWSNLMSIGTGIGTALWNKILTFWSNFTSMGSNIGTGLWNKITELWDRFATIGSNIAVGLWNKIIKFDFGSLFNFGGGGGGIGFWAAGGEVNYLAAGGRPRGTDTVPAMLTPGEFIMSRGAVQAMGLGNMEAINSGRMPVSQTSNANYEINVQMSFDGMPDEQFVRTRLVPQIKRELKAATQNGELLVSKRGVF